MYHIKHCSNVDIAIECEANSFLKGAFAIGELGTIGESLSSDNASSFVSAITCKNLSASFDFNCSHLIDSGINLTHTKKRWIIYLILI